MTGHHCLRNVEVVALGDLRKKAVTADDVLERSRPSAARIANSPILQIEGRHASRSQRGTRMPGMLKIILRAPESAMNIHHDRKRPFPFGKPEIAKLIWIGTVGQAHICGWRRLIEHVFRHARYSTTELSVTLEKKTTGGVRSLPSRVAYNASRKVNSCALCLFESLRNASRVELASPPWRMMASSREADKPSCIRRSCVRNPHSGAVRIFC